MKNALKGLAVAAMLVAPLAADNLENPLFAPKARGLYSKTALGFMSKEVDDSLINVLKGTNGEKQSVTRFYEDLGYGITDRLALQLSIGYTSNSDADRSGMHQDRLGLSFRALDNDAPFVWDVYADAHLGGISAMEAELANTKNWMQNRENPAASQFGLNYKNYTTGQWGAYVGARVGKQLDKVALAAFAEICQKFAGSNNEITVNGNLNVITEGGALPLAEALPPTFSVELKPTMDYNFGLKCFYQISDGWSCGASYTYKYHADNEAESVLLEPLQSANPTQTYIVGQLKAGFVGSLKDGYDEHVANLSLGYSFGPKTQLIGFFEYTSDSAFDTNCQNTTASKIEAGLRLNVKF
jgi:hypothetical protein